MIGALPVEAMLIVEGEPLALPLIMLGTQKPALCCLDEHAVRKVGSHPEQGDGGVGVGSVLFPTEDRQAHLGHVRMGHLVQQHEEHVADHELGHVLARLRQGVIEARVGARVDRLGVGRPDRLSAGRSGAHHQRTHQSDGLEAATDAGEALKLAVHGGLLLRRPVHSVDRKRPHREEIECDAPHRAATPGCEAPHRTRSSWART